MIRRCCSENRSHLGGVEPHSGARPLLKGRGQSRYHHIPPRVFDRPGDQRGGYPLPIWLRGKTTWLIRIYPRNKGSTTPPTNTTPPAGESFRTSKAPRTTPSSRKAC